MSKKNSVHTFKRIVRSVTVFLLFFCSAYLQYIPIKLFRLDIQNISESMEVMLSVFSEAVILIVFFFIYRRDLREDFQKFIKHPVRCLDTGFRYWMVGLIIMMVSNSIIHFYFNAGQANNEQAVQSMIKALPWMMVLNAGVLAPINEEIVFRKAFRDVFSNKWLFVFLSFLFFGGAHVVLSASSLVDYLYIIPYGVLGASFALSYYETDSIFTSICLHMFHNMILVLLSVLL